MKSLDIRKKFFDFFVKNNHEKVTSSSLIPAQDPTLLFTNAGMNQFKDCFLGIEKRSYTRAASIQKCVRAGGKHNDLDNVGFTKRHLTFFEMMGNFSFGDYFKKDAIAFAWNLLTKEYALDADDLYVSVYQDDDEAANIWENDLGISKERIYRFGKKDNFWQMGDTGPCGPSSEIFYDTRPKNQREKPPTQEDFDSGILLEIWNLVFMQFEQQEDGSLTPLNQTGIDTGMGLERIACVLQGKDNVYETDLFVPLIKTIETITGRTYKSQDIQTKAAFHVLADHIRSSSLLIADGCSPSNEGRGYVLRKIIRRAALFAQKLSNENIFPKVAIAFIKEMAPIYPELKTNETMIVSLLTNEIEQFAQNLIKGQTILERFFEKQSKSKIISGEQAFKLYDTYGFPLEVTTLVAQENGFSIDSDGFEKAMAEQRVRSGKKNKATEKRIVLPDDIITEFVGYKQTEATSKIIGLLDNEKLIDSAKEGQEVWVITEHCPFFASTGGQVDDTCWITLEDKKSVVTGLKKIDNAIAFKIKAPRALQKGQELLQFVDKQIRKKTMNNHTATHLLQAALIELLGKQIKQSGSVVDPDYLRFDFTYHQNLTPEQITWVENKVNAKIRENILVDVSETTYKKALDKGVIAIFGEKYNPECVRVIDVPGFSAELCGGTHVPSTGVIGAFKIIEMSALSAGNRRIFAVTGPKAIELMQENFNSIKTLSQEFKVKPEEVVATVQKQKEQLATYQTQLKSLKKELFKSHIPKWLEKIEEINSVPFLYLSLKNYAIDEMREITQQLQKQTPGFYMLISSAEDKSSFIASLAPQYEETIDMKAFAKWLQESVGLRGGGKKGILQGGGPRVTQDLGPLIKKGLSK
jgi:alanyl-tRNA synthetase